MNVTVSLTRREAEAVLRAELSNGYGIVRSTALLVAEQKIKRAVWGALNGRRDPDGMTAPS